MRNSLAIVLLVIAMIGCTPSVPSEYIQPGELEDILYDYHVAKAMASETRSGDAYEENFRKNAYFLAVLKKYDVTEAVFDSSLVYYYSHADHLKKIYDDVKERLNDEAKALGASVGDINKYSVYSTTGDTANVWQNETDLLLMPLPTMNRYDISVQADTSYYKGDTFMFQFMTNFLYQSGTRDATVCLVAKYEGDSITQSVSHISIDGQTQIRIPQNREGKLKELKGFIYLNNSDRDKEARKMLFISQIQLIRFHQKTQNDKQETREEVKADSLPGTPDTPRSNTDTVRSGDREREGKRVLPIDRRAPGNRVDKQSLKLNKK